MISSISISIPISIFIFFSISILVAIYMKGKFQYQYQNQYFELAYFNNNININMTNILVFQYFSIYCPTSDLKESWYHTHYWSLLPPSKLMSHGIDWMFTWHLCQKHPFTNLTGVNLASKRHCTYNIENRTIHHQLNALSKRADWQGTNIAHTKWCLPNKSQPIFWNAKRVFSTHQTKWNGRERRLSVCAF